MLTVLELEDPQLDDTDPDGFTHAQISSVGQQAEVELHIYRCRIVFKNHCLLNIILGSMQFYRKTLLLLCTSVGDPCVSCFNHKLNPYLLL